MAREKNFLKFAFTVSAAAMADGVNYGFNNSFLPYRARTLGHKLIKGIPKSADI